MKFGYFSFVQSFFRSIALIAVLGSSFFAAGCMKSMTQRIKVTVRVQDGSQIYSGSAVQEFTCTETDNRWQGMAIGGCKIKGEAVPIKIGDKGWLFMIFSGSQGQGTNPEYYTGAIQNNQRQLGNEEWNVSTENAPMMVTFHDLNDPKSIIEVKPMALSDVFGNGVELKSIHVERTKDWVTRGSIERSLPWLREIGYNNLEGEFSTSGSKLSGRLIKTNFIWR